MNSGRKLVSSLPASLVALAVLAGPPAAFAQTAPTSYVASPEVYKLLSENEQFRVILVNWKAGQRDAWHSHAGPLTTYRLTDCKLRTHTPDGKTSERATKRGDVTYNPVIASHSIENTGSADCQILMVERK